MDTITITIKHGMTREITREVPAGTTVSAILRDPSNKAVLGYGENVSAVIDGITVGGNEEVNDGDVIQIERQAAAKA